LSGARPPSARSRRSASAFGKLRQVVHEGAKFGIVGLIGIGVTNVLFGPLHTWLHLGVLTSVTIATVAATVVTFLGNRYWSFRHREGWGTRRESVMFFMLNGLGLLIQYAVLGFSNYALGLTTKLDNYIALNIGIGLGTLFRFWSYRKWVWVPPEVHLARLRRGRHRRGRTTPVPPPPEPALAVTRPPGRAGPGHRADQRHRADGAARSVRRDTYPRRPASDAKEPRARRTPARW
jgi:putative flippase GtrA